MLKISHLSKHFGHKQVLQDISLEVKSGEIALLLGSSGSGKSTLLRILNGLEQKDSGSITLDNQELNAQLIQKAHAIGMVFQNYNLFEHMTVEENITFALIRVLKMSQDQAKLIAHNFLEKYNLLDKAQDYAFNLSGGQKQRLALARTLALKPQVICLDEPTSALDPLLTNYVAQLIQELAAQGYIVLVASHDTQLIAKLNCTIYLLEHGKIVERADSEEFKHNPEKFKQIKKFIQG